MSKDKMTPTPWKVEITESKFPVYSVTADIEEGANNTICNLFTATMGEKESQEFNASAIVSAVNNTYGAAIDPNQVPDLLRAAEMLLKLSNGLLSGTAYRNPDETISFAKATIDKARL
jgi:hypothetical protein